MFNRFLFFAATLALNACTTTVQIYEGNNRPAKDVANIVRDYDAAGRHIKIDGIAIGSDNAELLPGEYLLSVMYKQDWRLLAEDTWTAFPVYVRAGEKYKLHSMPLKVRTIVVEGDPPEVRRAKTWQRGYTVGKSKYTDKLFFWLENKNTGETAGGFRPERLKDDRTDEYRVRAGAGVEAEL